VTAAASTEVPETLVPGRVIRPLAGPALIAISVIHFATASVFYGPGLRAIVDAGIVNAVEPGSVVYADRAAAFWYVVAGMGTALLGYLVWWLERRIGIVPSALGWLLVAFVLATVLLVPVSGFWLFLGPAAVVISRSRRHTGRAADRRTVS